MILDSTRFEARVAQLKRNWRTGQLAEGNVASVAEARAKVMQATAKRDQAVRTLRRYQGAPMPSADSKSIPNRASRQ